MKLPVGLLLFFFLFETCQSFSQGISAGIKAKQDTGKFHRQYYLLKSQLERYEKIEKEGGWRNIPQRILKLKTGDRDSGFVLLRERLGREGFPVGKSDKQDSLDDKLKQAISSFQKNMGLNNSGLPDKKTIYMLNLPVERRIETIRVNMERWKNFEIVNDERYISVNIPDFTLQVLEKNDTVLSMKVVTGRPSRKTPVLKNEIGFLIFNPPWNIPPGILKADIIPDIQKDSLVLKKRGIRAYKKDPSGKRIAVAGKEIAEGDPESYVLTQVPGERNAMGKIKFMFPNRFNIYLHDTPQKELFQKETRAFSSGCVRLENAPALAEYLLKDLGWTKENVADTISAGKTRKVVLGKPVDVYINYFTAWVDGKGVLQFRLDIYGRDVCRQQE
jgi:L,D-transpeptidase YcbB